MKINKVVETDHAYKQTSKSFFGFLIGGGGDDDVDDDDDIATHNHISTNTRTIKVVLS